MARGAQPVGRMTWGGAQWVLLTCFVIMTVAPPFIRLGFIHQGYTSKRAWPEFWGNWFADLVGRLFVAALLIWGGFWA